MRVWGYIGIGLIFIIVVLYSVGILAGVATEFVSAALMFYISPLVVRLLAQIPGLSELPKVFEPPKKPGGDLDLGQSGTRLRGAPPAEFVSAPFPNTAPVGEAFPSVEQYLKDASSAVLRRLEDGASAGDPVALMMGGPAGSGKRSVIRNVYSKLMGGDVPLVDPVEVYFFDCSARPRVNLYSDFLFWLGSTYSAYKDRAEGLRRGDPISEDEVLLEPLLYQELEERGPKSVVLIAEGNLLFPPDSPAYRTFIDPKDQERARRVFENVLIRNGASVVLSFSSVPPTLSKALSRFASVDAREEGHWEKHRDIAFSKLTDVSNLDLTCLGFEHAVMLIRTLGAAKPDTDRLQVLTSVVRMRREHLGNKVTDLALDNAADAERDTDRALFESALLALSRFEWPLSDYVLRIVLREVLDAAGRPKTLEGVMALRDGLTGVGLLHELRQFAGGDVPHLYLTIIARAWVREESKLNEVFKRDLNRFSELSVRLALDHRPGTPTPLSEFLSRTDFRWAGELSGLLRTVDDREVCVVPLGNDIVRAMLPTPGAGGVNYCRLLEHSWSHRGGTKQDDLAVVISCVPHPWWEFWRVRVHIVSAEGSGSDVLEAIEAVAGQVVYAEGDAYRCGPGGVVEVVVRLKEGVRLNRSADLAERQERPIQVARRLEERLRSYVDYHTVVNVTPCCPPELETDILDGGTHLSEGVRVEMQCNLAPRKGPALLIEGPALQKLQERNTGGPRPGRFAPVELQGYVSSSIGQAVLVAGHSDVGSRSSVYLWSKPDSSGSSTEATPGSGQIAITFMRVAAELGLNLLALRPLGSFGCRADFEAMPGESYGLVEHIRSRLDLQNVEVTLLRTLGEGARSEIGEDIWASLTPGVYHREMRKHLYLADADAAVVALACQHLGAALAAREYRALEIGAGTGALTEKLVRAGVANLDFLEYAERLMSHWTTQVAPSLGGAWCGHCIRSKVEHHHVDDADRYDLVISQGVHHHLLPERGAGEELEWETVDQHRKELMQHVAQLLKPGGLFIVSDEFLADYAGDEGKRIEHLDKWYEIVIAAALSDGLPELAQMEHSFWLSDRNGSGEYKESLSVFEGRVGASVDVPFVLETRVLFGLTAECPGGFAVYALRKSSTQVPK